jgi:hypothetical protein
MIYGDNGIVPSEAKQPIDEVRDAIWRSMLNRPGDDWFATRVRQLLTAAQDTPLRVLFPYTSHNSLHLSRCSYYPFTHDCPWIWFATEPHFITYAPHADGLQGNLADPPPPVLLDTDDARAAIAATVDALPPHWHTVWVGDIDDQP